MEIKLQNLTKKYGSTLAVCDFTAQLPDGKLICLLGPSGCGKSTLLNMICGIVDVTSGKIFFDGKDVTKTPPDKRNIGMVFQNYALYPHMTVLENICFPLEVQKMPKQERVEKAKKIAALVHVDTLLKRYPGELSGGQQQRVAIARALVKNPQILLMDEPLSNLDARLRLEMREEIKRIQVETGVTTIFVTHDQEEAMSISDSIILMKDGKLIQSSTCQELYENPSCKFAADFLGNPPINNMGEGKVECKEGGAFFVFDDGKIRLPLPKALSQVQALANCGDKNSPHGDNGDGEKLSQYSDTSALPSEKITLSVRPEAFATAESATGTPQGGQPSVSSFQAQITRISLLGKEQILYIKLFESENGQNLYPQEYRIILSNDQDYKEGQNISLKLKEKGLFLFDGQGKRI